MATINQLRNRMHNGHRRVLQAVADGQPVTSPGVPDSILRGYQKCGDTLHKWGAIDARGITDIGRQLLNESTRKADEQ